MPSDNKQIKIGVTPEDYMRISQLAKAEGISRAEWIRLKLDMKIENAPEPKCEVVFIRADPRLLYQINRIGNNINQIARKLHQRHVLERRVLLKIYEKVMTLL